jgi:hypothetical protein
LRQDEKAAEDKDCDDRRSQRAAQGKAAVTDRLVEEVAGDTFSMTLQWSYLASTGAGSHPAR